MIRQKVSKTKFQANKSALLFISLTDPLSHEWERGPIAAGLVLPLARLRERGLWGEGLFSMTARPIDFFTGSSFKKY
jgi:hypothetical protein